MFNIQIINLLWPMCSVLFSFELLASAQMAFFELQRHRPAATEMSQALLGTYEVPETSSMDLGKGFAPLNQEILGDCVVASRLARSSYSSENSKIGKVIYNSVEISSLDQLKDLLELNAKASLNWGFGSGDAKASYLRSQNFNSYSFYFLLRVKVLHQSSHLIAAHLSPDARQVLLQLVG